MREFAWILWLVVVAVSVLVAMLFGIAGAMAAGRWLNECQAIAPADLPFTSDCEDAKSMMLVGAVAVAIGGAGIVLAITRMRP